MEEDFTYRRHFTAGACRTFLGGKFEICARRGSHLLMFAYIIHSQSKRYP